MLAVCDHDTLMERYRLQVASTGAMLYHWLPCFWWPTGAMLYLLSSLLASVYSNVYLKKFRPKIKFVVFKFHQFSIYPKRFLRWVIHIHLPHSVGTSSTDKGVGLVNTRNNLVSFGSNHLPQFYVITVVHVHILQSTNFQVSDFCVIIWV